MLSKVAALVLDGVAAFPRVLSPLVSPCLPLSPLAPPCLPLSRLPEVLFPLLFSFVDGVSAFPRPCLPLSPFLFPFVGWPVHLPEVLSSRASPHVCPCWMVSASTKSSQPLSPIVSGRSMEPANNQGSKQASQPARQAGILCLCWILC